MPRRRHGKPYKRGPYLHKTPYKKTALIAASTSVNARLRHLGEDDPVRAKILKLRATKGHIAAHEFVEKMFPDRATFQKYRLKAAARVSTKTSTKTSTRTSTKTSMTGKAPRASAELRAKFAEAISKLPAEEQHRVLIRKRKEGIGPTLAWLGNGHGNGHAQVAEV